MIKNFQATPTTLVRLELGKSPVRPALQHAYRLIGSLSMIPAGVYVVPNVSGNHDRYFLEGSEHAKWLKAQFDRASRVHIVVTHERISDIKVEVRWYPRGGGHWFAEFMAFFNDFDCVQASQSSESETV